jgi:non-homologous end joining protein Ku
MGAPGLDSRCLDLAKHFLAGEPGATEADAWNLATVIQDAVENWMSFDQRSPRQRGQAGTASPETQDAPQVIDLMAALKASLAKHGAAPEGDE